MAGRKKAADVQPVKSNIEPAVNTPVVEATDETVVLADIDQPTETTEDEAKVAESQPVELRMVLAEFDRVDVELAIKDAGPIHTIYTTNGPVKFVNGKANVRVGTAAQLREKGYIK